MRRQLAALAALTALLVGTLLALGPRDPGGGRAPRLVRLVDAARPGETVVAGLSLERPPGGARVVYVRSKGVWRCLSAWGAPCDAQLVEGLVLGLLGARGVVRAPSGDSTDWGLAGPEALELALHGKQLLDDPGGDELLRVRFGTSSRVAGAAPGTSGGAFARVASRAQVLELDLDPRPLLGPPDPGGLPPLLDRRLVPLDVPGAGRRIERLFLDRADGTGLELVRREREARPPEPGIDPAETLDWEWLLITDGRQAVIPPLRGEAYVTWLPRAPFVALADPRSAAERGLDAPRVRLTLVPSEGEPLELSVGAEAPGGGAWVHVPALQRLVAVDATALRLLLPEVGQLEDDALRNEWDQRLRAELSAR